MNTQDFQNEIVRLKRSELVTRRTDLITQMDELKILITMLNMEIRKHDPNEDRPRR